MKQITLTLIAAMGLALTANAQQQSNTTSTAAPTKAEVEQEAHKWVSYEVYVENTTLSDRANSELDATVSAEINLNIPGAIKTAAGDITNSIGVDPELADFEAGKTGANELVNNYAHMYNTLALKENSSPLSTVMAYTLVDLNQIDGTGTDTAFYIIGLTKKAELADRLTLSGAPGVKFYADATAGTRLFASAQINYKVNDSLSIDALRTQLRYRVDQDDNSDRFTRARFGPRVKYSFANSMYVNGYAFVPTTNGAEAGVSVTIGGSL